VRYTALTLGAWDARTSVLGALLIKRSTRTVDVKSRAGAGRCSRTAYRSQPAREDSHVRSGET